MSHLKEDRRLIVATMVDYYALPQAGPRAWPGRKDAVGGTPDDIATAVEKSLLADVVSKMPTHFNPSRFVPYIAMHEFEALLFSDCVKFAQSIELPELAPRFRRIRDGFPTPEHIDDSPHAAPSKRIEALIPNYDKPWLGLVAADEIGLEVMRAECPHFGGWLGRLEALPGQMRI